MIPAIFVLMPIALYPVYLVDHARSERRGLLAPVPGAAVLAVRAAMVPVAAPDPQHRGGGAAQGLSELGRAARQARGRRPAPIRSASFSILTAASALAYVPLALIYSPWAWFQYSAFAFQWCRPLHYTVYFFAGAAVGAYGLERGLLASDGVLARRWPLAVGAAILGLALWMTPTAIIMEGGNDNPGPLWLQLAANLGFVVCCAGGCLAVMAVCIRFATNRRRWLDSLSANAYGMYLVHYPFVVWMQYALLNAPLPAIVKAAIVFAVAVALSWAHGRGLAQHSARRPAGRRGAAGAGKDVVTRAYCRYGSVAEATHVARPQTRVPEPVSRSAAIDRDRHRHRVLDRAGDRADGPLCELRAHGHGHDRPCRRRSLDRAARHQVLRGPFPARRARALSRAVGRRRGVGGAAGDRLCAVAHAVGRQHADLHDRLRPARRRTCSPGTSSKARRESLAIPGAVAIDRSYFDRLETTRVGDYAEIGDQKVQVVAITNGIRSFTTTPYVFSSIDRARAYTGTAANKASYFLVRVTPGANVTPGARPPARAAARHRGAHHRRVPRPQRQFLAVRHRRRRRSVRGRRCSGLIVGTVIVAQTLYSSTKDHLNEFATLRAIGSSGSYIHKVIIFQALLSAVIGFCIAATIGWIVVIATADTALPVVITPLMTAALLVLTVADVRRVRHRGHHEGDADRSCDGVHAMTDAGDRSHRYGQVPGRRRRPRAGAQGRQPGGHRRRADAADGTVGERQDHAALHPRMHADADQRHGAGRRPADRRRRSRGARQDPPREHRLRVPVLSSVPDPHRARQCAARARRPRRELAPRDAEVEGGAGQGRARAQDGLLSAGAQRRRAAARRHRARHRRQRGGDPRRRADRRARQRERPRHHGGAGGDRARQRPRRVGRHPRPPYSPVRRPHRPHRGRQDHRRRARVGSQGRRRRGAQRQRRSARTRSESLEHHGRVETKSDCRCRARPDRPCRRRWRRR